MLDVIFEVWFQEKLHDVYVKISPTTEPLVFTSNLFLWLVIKLFFFCIFFYFTKPLCFNIVSEINFLIAVEFLAKQLTQIMMLSI